MNVYVNLETMEIKTIIDTIQHYDVDTEAWEEDINEVEENFDKYFQFERMDSRESYQVMEDFVETVQDTRLRDKLELGLSLSKPFRNFKDIIDDENEYRKSWFEFRDARYIEFVIGQIERHNRAI
jgi:cobalamin biosynthesis Mg chelatase CobN